jgi:hypothetical protein
VPGTCPDAEKKCASKRVKKSMGGRRCVTIPYYTSHNVTCSYDISQKRRSIERCYDDGQLLHRYTRRACCWKRHGIHHKRPVSDPRSCHASSLRLQGGLGSPPICLSYNKEHVTPSAVCKTQGTISFVDSVGPLWNQRGWPRSLFTVPVDSDTGVCVLGR